jgi:hypothetical protein
MAANRGRTVGGWVWGGTRGGICGRDFRGGTTGRRDVRERGHGEQRGRRWGSPARTGKTVHQITVWTSTLGS